MMVLLKGIQHTWLIWVRRKYHLKRLPTGVVNYPDIFQQKMHDLFKRLIFICACMEELLVLTKIDYTYHVQKLELMLNKLK